MFKSIRTFSFLFGYLPAAAVNLKRFKAKKAELSTEEYAKLVHTEPQKWSKGIMQRAGSTVDLRGAELLPDGPVLLVSNHEGNFDIPVLLSSIEKPFAFISKVEVKKLPIIPTYMEEMNCVFLDRTDRRSAFKSIEDTVEKLTAGQSILIFPEGSRSKGQGLGDFKSGFTRIAKGAAVPIVPIAISGTSAIMEKNDNKIMPAHVHVEILEPILPEQVADMDAKQLIGTVREEIEKALEKIQLLMEERKVD